MKKALFTAGTSITSPMLALAQVTTITINGNPAQQGQINGTALTNLIGLAQTIVARLVPFAIGLAVLVFFWFLIELIWKGRSDPAKQKEAMRGMGYSILALFVMVSIWGIVGFLGSVLGIGQGGSVPVPGIPVPAA